ncbi:MAG: MFS transporter [SAR86 cluster bacterium]|nr:MFS transporter [SAR86 cluster bacterium]
MDKKIYPPVKVGYYSVGLMALAQIFAFIDRQIPALLIEPIKADFDLSDSQIALLGGAAFSVFYALMAIPIGFAVDRYRRTYILGVGIFLWSIMTFLTGLANSFFKLFSARVGVAVGEAVMAPTSVSLVGDYFPEEKQGKPLGIITAGVYIGIGITLLGGGFLIDYLTNLGGLNIPVIGFVKPWQATFMLVGIPGVLVSLLVILMHEPKRIHISPQQLESRTKYEILDHLNEFKSTLVFMFLGLIFMAFIFYSFTFWGPTMMLRTFDLSLSEVGLTLGLITILSSITGTISSGAIVDYLRKLGFIDAPVRVALFASFFACPFIVLAPLVNSVLLSWILIGFYLFFISSFAPLGLIAVSGVSRGNVKGQMAAFHAFLMMVFGFSIGPQLTAFFTDFIFMDSMKLGWAISLTAALTLPLSGLFFWFSLSKYRSAVKVLQLN